MAGSCERSNELPKHVGNSLTREELSASQEDSTAVY